MFDPIPPHSTILPAIEQETNDDEVTDVESSADEALVETHNQRREVN